MAQAQNEKPKSSKPTLGDYPATKTTRASRLFTERLPEKESGIIYKVSPGEDAKYSARNSDDKEFQKASDGEVSRWNGKSKTLDANGNAEATVGRNALLQEQVKMMLAANPEMSEKEALDRLTPGK